MMVKDPIIASGAVGANAMAAAMVKVVLLGCASGGEEPGDEQRNDQKSKHRILLLVRVEAKMTASAPHAFNLLFLPMPANCTRLHPPRQITFTGGVFWCGIIRGHDIAATEIRRCGGGVRQLERGGTTDVRDAAHVDRVAPCA